MRALLRSAVVLLSLAACSREPPPPAPVEPPPSAADSWATLTSLARWDTASPAARRLAAEEVARRMPDFALLRMETFSCGGQTHEVALFRHARTEMEFALVPGGTFTMGSAEPETNPGACDPHPPHPVTLTRPFVMARTHATQRAWMRLMGADPSTTRGDDLPVQDVDWNEASTFCDRAGLELPTEAQWEWACRAGTTSTWFFGADEHDLGDFAWTLDLRAAGARPKRGGPGPVGTKKPNAFGLFDMSGNVAQWCVDAATVRDGRRVLRGGSWLLALSSARRASMKSTQCDGATGFRPAKTVPDFR